jgi:pyruvate/2-oxoglutarate/acetoin dehydrogenase E1 component
MVSLKAAIRDNDPVIFMNQTMYGEKEKIPDREYIIPIGV